MTTTQSQLQDSYKHPEEATLFTSRSEAEYCADCNNRDDSDWTYKVGFTLRGYTVAAYDHDGEMIGYL